MQDRNRLTPYAIPGIRKWTDLIAGAKQLTSEKILNATCEYFGLTFDEIRLRRRLLRLVYPRQCTVYLFSQYTKLTLKEMSDWVGGGDHSTMIHSRDTIAGRLKVDDGEVRADIDAIYEIAMNLETVSDLHPNIPLEHSNYNYETSLA